VEGNSRKRNLEFKKIKFRRNYSWRKEFGIKDSESRRDREKENEKRKRKEKIENGIRNLDSGIPNKKKKRKY
jgi:hypothetical protein